MRISLRQPGPRVGDELRAERRRLGSDLPLSFAAHSSRELIVDLERPLEGPARFRPILEGQQCLAALNLYADLVTRWVPGAGCHPLQRFVDRTEGRVRAPC